MMRFRLICVLIFLASLLGCGTAPQPVITRSYNGSASVGDFLTITIDTSALTISYTDISNGDSGTVPYTVNADGSYAISDPTGNLIAAYEIPNYAMVIEAAKTGPNQDTPALITAVESGPISVSTFSGNSYNYMQFRTTSGGVDVGSIAIAGTSGQTSDYWPYGAITAGADPAFYAGTQDFSSVVEDPSGTFMTMTSPPSQGGGTNYIFGTASGIFIVDTPSGTILGLQQAATADFDPSVAGTYNTIYYQKTDASTGEGNVETGNASLGKASIVITAAGGVTMTDSNGNVLTPPGTTLAAVADTSYLYGSPGELENPCYGLFTFRVTTASTQQDVFVTFINNAVMLSSFEASLPWTPGDNTYNYFYGVGLKQ